MQKSTINKFATFEALYKYKFLKGDLNKSVKKSGFNFPAFSKHESIILLLIMALTVIIYAKGVNNTFTVADDDTNIVLNDNIKDLSFQGIKKIFTEPYQDDYRPLTYLSYMAIYSLFGLNATAFFLANLLLHLFNTVLVFYFIRLLKNSLVVSGITALLFAIHPMHVESVAWLSAHNDVLYSFFFLLSLISYLFYYKGKPRKYLWLSVLFFLLSVLSKPLAIILPLILIVLDYYLAGKVKLSSFRDKAPHFGIAMIFAILTLTIRNPGEATASLVESYTVFDRFLFSCYALNFYLFKLIFPFDLSAFYYFPEKINDMLPRGYLFSPVLVFLLIYAIYKAKKHKTEIIFSTLFFLINLLPVLQLIPFGTTIVAERYSYLAYIGPFFLAGYFYDLLLKKEWDVNETIKKIVTGAMVVFLLFFIFRTWERIEVWQNSIHLTSDVIEKYPDRAMAYHHRGLANNMVKNYNSAIEDFDVAITINPEYADAFANRGTAKFYLGDYEGALKDYNKAIDLQPDDISVLNNRGMVKNALQDYKGAISDFNKVLKEDPAIANAYLDRGNAKFYLGYPEEAIEDFNKAILLNPDYADALANRGAVYLNLNEVQKACVDLRKASSLGHQQAQQNYRQNCR